LYSGPVAGSLQDKVFVDPSVATDKPLLIESSVILLMAIG
jgi:hypothetical protein